MRDTQRPPLHRLGKEFVSFDRAGRALFVFARALNVTATEEVPEEPQRLREVSDVVVRRRARGTTSVG